MQLYALDENSPVLAGEAVKQKNYQCPECLTFVRLRGGPHRQFHFYHTRSRPSCRQHQKSLAHLQLQLHLKSLIPNSSLEKPFSQINRIADVAWEEKRIVFEIQCSPISLSEVQSRSEDYAKVGYTAVWILHDRRFNKKNLSAAEFFLRTRKCYFGRENLIYDQFEILQGSRRVLRGPQLPIDPTQPIFQNNALSFIGDLANRSSKNPRATKKRVVKRRLSFKKIYLFFFDAILEKFVY